LFWSFLLSSAAKAVPAAKTAAIKAANSLFISCPGNNGWNESKEARYGPIAIRPEVAPPANE
jgi:hypothetical protein